MPSTKECPNPKCKRENPATYDFCYECGTSLEQVSSKDPPVETATSLSQGPLSKDLSAEPEIPSSYEPLSTGVKIFLILAAVGIFSCIILSMLSKSH